MLWPRLGAVLLAERVRVVAGLAETVKVVMEVLAVKRWWTPVAAV